MTQPLALLPTRPLSRLITVVCDLIPDFGKIKEHKFVSTLGAGVKFVASDHAHPGFNIHIEPSDQYWTAQELRELAEECVSMASYLDKRAGIVSKTSI